MPAELSERLTALRRRRTLRAAVREEAEDAVASLAFGTDPAVWIPKVPLSPARNAPEPRLLERGTYLAGLRADGRPVLVRRAFGQNRERPAAVLAHPSEETDEHVIQARVLRWAGARLEVIGFLTHTSVSHVTWIDHDDQGRPVRFATAGTPANDFDRERKLAWCDWDGDRCVRVDERLAGSGDRWLPIARSGEYDAEGLLRVRSVVGDPEDAPAAVASLVPADVGWRRDRDAYDPDPLPVAHALTAYAEAVADAVRAVVTEPAAVIKVHPAFAHDYRPSVTIFDDAFDAAGLAAWRSLRQHDVDTLPATAVRALQERLAAAPLPGDALAVVWSGEVEMWALARAVYGDDRVDALGTDAPRQPLEANGPPAPRAELEQAVAAAELPPSVAALAAWGLAIVPGGQGRSRLGGAAALPPGMDWPTAEGRPLTHLASLWLDELPNVENRELLPPGACSPSSPTSMTRQSSGTRTASAATTASSSCTHTAPWKSGTDRSHSTSVASPSGRSSPFRTTRTSHRPTCSATGTSTTPPRPRSMTTCCSGTPDPSSTTPASPARSPCSSWDGTRSSDSSISTPARSGS